MCGFLLRNIAVFAFECVFSQIVLAIIDIVLVMKEEALTKNAVCGIIKLLCTIGILVLSTDVFFMNVPKK